MSRQSWEVLWSPNNPNKFVKYIASDSNSDIVLYNVFNSDDNGLPQSSKNKSVVHITDDIFAYPVADYLEFSSIKSVAWCPQKDLSDYCVLAVGSSNGRVSLLNIGDAVPSSTGLALNQEFAPKAERTCHEVAWNEQEPNLLAVGLDKVRYDNSLLVWDVETKSVISQASGNTESRSSATSKKAVFEHGASESTVSVQWLQNKPRTLVAGQGSKWLRLFDIRSPDPKVLATTKAINGISVDKNNCNRIASFAEGAVLVWDIRNSEKPLVTINQSKSVSKIQWCPSRAHMLTVLQKDSSVVKCYDLQYLSGNKLLNMDEETESIFYERTIHLPKLSKSTINSFSWHPAENKILVISASGELNYMKIYEKIAMSWSPSLEFVWGCGKYLLSCSHLEDSILKEQDISYIMKQRAVAGYGIKSILKDQNQIRKVLKNTSLVNLWDWLHCASRTKDSDARKTRHFLGVKAIIKEDMVSSVQNSFDSQEDSSTPKHYSSVERTSALKLCDWDVGEAQIKDKLYKLTIDGEPERAAAMALFNNRLHLAIELLSYNPSEKLSKNTPTDSSLPIVAMALSGFSEKRPPLWVSNCKLLSTQLKNPYLRAIFAFLTAEDDNYINVIKEKEIKLQDRVAFACRYLNDSKLISFIDNETTTFINTGNLEGLLLTGLTSDGLDLLENYINKTSDVQTAVLIVLNTKVIEAVRDPRVNNWIENYRDLLDRWRLWHERSHFDALVQSSCGNRKIPQQISVTCTYCSKAVSHNLISSGGMRGSRQPHGMGTNSRQSKAMACPNCRQPLPRCSICMINMGSLSSHTQKLGNRAKFENVVNPYLNWFTWCQMCRHGGHSVHLIEWFTDHLHCPVTGCNCTCNVHDSVAMVSPTSSDENVDNKETS
ncbi:GATOR2 complex protein MIOS-B isoform X2 [Hydra vulgaris]|uniref:GATOR2 complex protein MIOS-B isoform X2 n=1 Tax=Hydra vulgaris TaxID=6087 RepID=A0ABM4CX77_HYDVU